MSKIIKMDRQTFLTLTTSSQWALFIATALIIYSWVERKKMIEQAGQLLFVVLGIFSLWVLLNGQIIVPDVLPDQAAPAEAKALTFFSGLVITAALGFVGFIASFLKPSWSKIFNILLVPVALSMFFMVYQLQRQ